MARVVGVLFLIALYIYGIIDVSRTPGSDMRTLPKWAWLIVVIVLPVIGTVLWLIFGRIWTLGTGRGRKRRIAPDDDPRFLKQLGDQTWSERMRRRRAEG